MSYRFTVRSTTPGTYRFKTGFWAGLVAAEDVLSGVDRGDGSLGTYSPDFPSVDNVTEDDTVNGAAGVYHEPAEAEVLNGIIFGANNTLTGTFVVPDISDVRRGVGYGAQATQFTGTLDAGSDLPADLTGKTFKQVIYEILRNDGASVSSGHLGALLDYNPTTKPEVVFHGDPPKEPAPPLVTYRINSETGLYRKIFIDITVWGGNIRAIHNRIYDLLHKRKNLTPSDWRILGLLYDSSGSELYDNDLKVHFQRARFVATVWKA